MQLTIMFSFKIERLPLQQNSLGQLMKRFDQCIKSMSSSNHSEQ